MQIVIAGGSGFLGSPLAETYAEDSHDVRVLTRGLAPGESRHESGTGVPGITRVGWRPDGQSGPWAAAIDGADAVDQPCRCVDRREALDAAAQGGAARQPHPRDPQPGRGDQGRRRRRRASSSVRARSATTERRPTATPRPKRRRPALTSSPISARTGRPKPGKAARDGMRLVTIRQRPRLRALGRSAREDDDAVPLFCRRPVGLGPPVHVVDSPPRLDRDGAVDRADARRRRDRSTSPRRIP